jgi:RHS repeat-associated protein
VNNRDWGSGNLGAGVCRHKEDKSQAIGSQLDRLLGSAGSLALAALVLLLFLPSAAVATTLPSTITEDMTLTAAGNPYTGPTVTIEPGVTLKAEPGVKFAINALIVKGALKAEGAAESPVLFTSEAKEPIPGEWGSIVFEAGSGASVLDHTEVVYAGSATNSGAIEVKGASPTITNSTIRSSRYYGVKVLSGGPHMSNSQIIGASSFGIYYESAESQEVDFHDNLVEGVGGSGAIFVVAGSKTVATSLGGNVVSKNSSTVAIHYNGGQVPPDVADNVVTGNNSAGADAITVGGVLDKSGTWVDPGAPINLLGQLVVPSGLSLTLKPGIVLRNGSLEVSGALKAEGEASKPVYFKSSSESSWAGSIKFLAGSGSSTLDYVETYRAGNTLNSGAIEVKGASPTITNSTIRSSRYYGVKVTESGSPNIKWNRFRGNWRGFSYSGTGSLVVSYNDWGCASGPQPAGCGDPVTSNVAWEPATQLPEIGGECRGDESQCGEGADPVSLATGRLSYIHRDLLLTNKSSVPLEFTRAYSSGSGADTGLGPGWSQAGLATASELESGDVLVVRQDGRQDLFQKTESGYKSPSGVTDTLAKVEGAFQLTTLDRTVYRFDSSGRIASITDDHGLKTTYAYNANRRLATITDPSGQTLTFSYNASNHITSVKDSTGREVKFGYSAAGDLETVTDALGGITKYGYDAQHRITSITDPRGIVILKNTYDGQGRITEQRDALENLWKLEYKANETIVTEPGGGKLTYGFDSQSRVVSETDQLGNKTTTIYDGLGNVSEVNRPGNAKWTIGHDLVGNITSILDPNGGERKYEYDSKNRPIKFIDARGNSWSYEWSAANDLTKVTDPEGGETTFTYNESGQPLTVTDPSKHKTELSYDSRGNRISLTNPLGQTRSFGYDTRNYLTSVTRPGMKAETFSRNALGDLLSRTTPEGHATKYNYDPNGMPTQITDPAEGAWKIAYNAMERPITYTDPAEQQATVAYNGNLKPTKITNRRGTETTLAYDLANRLTEVHTPEDGNWTFGYDVRGNRVSVTDPREYKTSYEYDLLDRMTTAKEPLSVTTEYSYDANGSLTSIKDPRGNTTAYSYDKLGRLTKVVQPLEKTTSFSYDGVGNMLSRTTAAGTVEYKFDAANRLTKVSLGGGTLRSFGYDSANRLTGATDAEGHKIEISYNEEDRVASINDGRGQSLTRSYDPRGFLTKQVDGRGTVEYGYDKLGRLTSLTDPQGKALSFAYDAEGDLTEVVRPNGVTTTNVYNEAGRLAETTSKTAEPLTVLEALKYSYDPAGNVVKRIDTRVEQETSYAYDALSRLTEWNPPGEGSTSYGYDAAGNRTEAGAITYTYNPLNQLTSSSDGATYTYDGAGRLTGQAKEAEETTYTWDPLDHLAKVEGPGGTVSYAFDALERLSERKSGEATQVTHYGDLTDLATYDANGEGKTMTSYIQGAHGLLEQRSGEATSYPLADAHGDVTAIASGAAEVISRQSYDPWGVQLSGPSLEFGYLGRQQRRVDPTTGLIQMGARSYSPGLGRFLAEDPIYGHLGIGASVDRYLYVWDNPLTRYDLNGRDVCAPTPFGDACAGDAAEDVGGAAKGAAETVGRTAGSAADDAWDWTAPGRQWFGNRAQDFWKAAKHVFPDIHISWKGNCRTLVTEYGEPYNTCDQGAEGELEYKNSESPTFVPPIGPLGPVPSPGSLIPVPVPTPTPQPVTPFIP